MDINLIKKPVITEKSTANGQVNKYIFEVTTLLPMVYGKNLEGWRLNK